MPKPLASDTITGQTLHEWNVTEYERHDRGPAWYIFMTLLGLFFVIYGMVTNNFLFSLIIILAAIILFLQTQQAPAQISFQITELGVIVSNRFYPYTEIDYFYIIYQPPAVKTLFIQNKSPLRPTLRIPLMDQNPIEIRHTLRSYVEENLEKEEEPTADAIARNWKLH